MEPFGSIFDNWQTAMLATLYARTHTPRNRKPPEINAFMFKDAETRREESLTEADRFFDAMRKGNGKSR